jgi:predicted RNA binding protein YcfA (HicA-like mRNA interferase family)
VSRKKTLQQVLSGSADARIRFDDLCGLLESSGFSRRTKGSHNIFRKTGVDERINLQRDGGHAKPYQVKQVRAVFLKYKLGSLDE